MKEERQINVFRLQKADFVTYLEVMLMAEGCIKNQESRVEWM